MKRFISLILALMIVFALAGCSGNTDSTGNTDTSSTGSTASEQQTITDTNADTETETPDFSGVSLNVGFLKGPTGIGAAYFMDQANSGVYPIAYNFTMESDPTNIVSALVSGSLDIAAVPTNVAAALYNKTGGNVKIAAINTLGVLYILEKGDSIKSVSDLAGKTIYATGQGSNPEYVLNYILTKNGLEPGKDVTIEYMASDELTTQMAAGNLDICMLPVPAVTTVLMKNTEVRKALDLTDEWDAISADGSVLTQGCIVFRSDKVDEAALNAFLDEYEESINYTNDAANLDAAAALAVKFEIVGSEAIAKAAIPDCNIVFVSGAETMKSYLAEYFNVLLAAAPNSIGGSLPGDDFYYDR
ncbi:MAG: ABC transporter substrate-binding protein [Oscillospiraceae bacterium]